MWWWVGGFTALLLLLVMVSYIQITFHLMRKGKDDMLRYDIKALLGLVRFRVEVPVVIFKGLDKGIDYKSEAILKNTDQLMAEHGEQMDKTKLFQYMSSARKLIQHVHQFKIWMYQTMSYIKCEKFRWNTELGSGDCPATAVLAGSVWGLKASIIGFISTKIKLQAEPELSVSPQYNQTAFSTEMFSVLKIRLAHALWANVNLLCRIMKVKGGFKTWARFAASIFKAWRKKKMNHP